MNSLFTLVSVIVDNTLECSHATNFVLGKWDLAPLDRFPLRGDNGLVLASESRHSAIIAKFNKPFVFDGKRKFIVQYVVTFQKTVDCGGAYLKLLTEGALKDLALFNDKTPYTIMFGPDKCGGAAKVRVLFLAYSNILHRLSTIFSFMFSSDAFHYSSSKSN